jgi:hypothetical protein
MMPHEEEPLPRLKFHLLTAQRAASRAPERSRVLAHIDHRPVRSSVCLFIAEPFRRRRPTVALLRAAVAEPATLVDR